jgi:tetrachlorobenzoquinone reductase
LTPTLTLHVHAKRREAEGVVSLDLRTVDGETLPSFTAGSHVDIHIPHADASGRPLIRQYSLCNDPIERHRYVVGVGRAADSAGGSHYLHDQLREGDRVEVGGPRNLFALEESAPCTVLIAGGIGITPLLAMARRLSALGREWTLYYCVRDPARAAFLAEAQALPGTVVPVFDGMPGISMLDLDKVAAAATPDTHLYCCGPAPLMLSFERATATRRAPTVHIEWFTPRTPDPAAAGEDGAFEVHLARTGRTLVVPADKSILDVLIEAGVDVGYGCCDGVCGSCEVRVLDGRPLHRDSILTGPDGDARDRMMICVSRCADGSLTLDL